MLTAFHFRQEIFAMFREAVGMDRAAVVIRAGDLPARVGEYPGPHQRMSLCCEFRRSVLALNGKSSSKILKILRAEVKANSRSNT